MQFSVLFPLLTTTCVDSPGIYRNCCGYFTTLMSNSAHQGVATCCNVPPININETLCVSGWIFVQIYNYKVSSFVFICFEHTEMYFNWNMAGNRSVLMFWYKLSQYFVSCSSTLTFWLDQNLFHEVSFMAWAERMWAGVQLHHNVSITAHSPLALQTCRKVCFPEINSKETLATLSESHKIFTLRDREIWDICCTSFLKRE